VNALTLSPALCALFLKSADDHAADKKGFSRRFFDASMPVLRQ
jgi:HAE1 family hydrophobic/amphiphilic exporter-1